MTTTQTDLLVSLDFAPALPCEHGTHDPLHLPDDPAVWNVLSICPSCGNVRSYLLCDSGHALFTEADAMLECDYCEAVESAGAFIKVCERIWGTT